MISMHSHDKPPFYFSFAVWQAHIHIAYRSYIRESKLKNGAFNLIELIHRQKVMAETSISDEDDTKDIGMAASTSTASKLPIRMISTVVRGFGRGSSDLGIPTANLDQSPGHFHSTQPFEDLPTGIYWGFARIGKEATTYKTACSIGYNPTYGNESKTIEPHLIAPENDPKRRASSCGESVLGDFYDQPIRLSVVGYLRPELPFEGLEKLTQAIKNDITNSERLGDGSDPLTQKEHAWVTSDDSL